MNKNDQEFLVQKIRSQYTEKQHTELDELKALDKQVKKLLRFLHTSSAAWAQLSWVPG